MSRDLRLATLYYKPANNQTGLIPDFYLYETDKWLVFPHELMGLHYEEIARHKDPEIISFFSPSPEQP